MNKQYKANYFESARGLLGVSEKSGTMGNATMMVGLVLEHGMPETAIL